MKKTIIWFLIIIMLLSMAGCRPEGQEDLPSNPAADNQPQNIDPDIQPDISQEQTPSGTLSENTKELSAEYPTKEIGYVMEDNFPAALSDFGLRLLAKTGKKGENALISPVSAVFALGMTAGGAKGETYQEIAETLLGKNSSLDLHHNLAAYRQKTDGAQEFHSANSIWFKNKDLEIKKEFLQQNADYYASEIFSCPFDQSTVEDVNAWVNEHTDGMIPSLLTSPPAENTVMYLVNALSFEDKWDTPFSEQLTEQKPFTAATGEKQTVDMMQGGSKYYLENENCTGFHKMYLGGYSFVALLPKENTTAEALIASLDGKGWHQLMIPKENSIVTFSLPKFKTEFSASLKEPLQEMGMKQAFEIGGADFSAMGTCQGEPLWIAEVLQKTVFELDEKGTKAAAATVVTEACGASVQEDPPKRYTVTLDRPFVYAIVDNNNVPVFLGIMNQAE